MTYPHHISHSIRVAHVGALVFITKSSLGEDTGTHTCTPIDTRDSLSCTFYKIAGDTRDYPFPRLQPEYSGFASITLYD